MNFFDRFFRKPKITSSDLPSTELKEEFRGLSLLNQIFDEVICLSLPNDAERREYIRDYFEGAGINHYKFYDATTPDAPVVEEFYWSERVKRYPVCFRCNKLECGKSDCNNVLIPSQVATAISHRNIWQYIVDQGLQNALIVEDDICFNDYAPIVIQQLAHQTAFKEHFLSHEPCLLRLGWKLKAEHAYTGTVELASDVIRMSNPCYAMNAAMAQTLLTHFEKVETTVDVYTHRWIAPQHAHHYTLFPPLAHELSASKGTVRSLIHPKPWRIDYLREQGASEDTIKQEEKILKNHVKHAIIRDVLVTGHPRCGSKYMGQLLQSFGLKIGHEAMDDRGISSWMFAADDADYPYGKDPYARSRRYTYFRHTIQYVRSPKDAIPSIVVENQYSEKSFEFRRKHIQRCFGIDLASLEPMDAAVASFVYWNKLVDLMSPNLTVRVEDDEQKLLNYLIDQQLVSEREMPCDRLPEKNINTQKPYKKQVIEKPELSQSDWGGVSPEFRKELEDFCHQHQYPSPWN